MSAVSLRAVRKSFGSTEVVHGVDISIADGEFCVLVGPSGCGKSTLLRIIAGLEEISAGEIASGARVVNALRPKERDIAMVFQNYALYPHMTVYDNMAFSLKLAGVAKDEAEQRVADASQILGLNDYLQRYPRQLSGGQRQRVAMPPKILGLTSFLRPSPPQLSGGQRQGVAMGRAMVRKPQVFLFDEPL